MSEFRKNIVFLISCVFLLPNVMGEVEAGSDGMDEDLGIITDKNSGINGSRSNAEAVIEESNKISADKSAATAKRKNKNTPGLMDKMLPVLITPFLISSAIIPFMLISIKLLLLKGFVVGKIAVILMLLNFFRRRVNGGGVFNHHIAQEHYGYQGVEEPGIYIHNRKKRRRRDLKSRNI